DLPADLCGMVHKMMAKNPAERYQSVREVLRDLVKVRDGIAVGLPPQPALSLSTSYPNGAPAASSTLVPSLQAAAPAAPARRWGLWLLAFVVCLLAVAGGVLVSVLLAPAHEQHTTRPAPPPDSPGLPDIRPAKKLVLSRERELIAQLDHRDTKPEELVKAS